MTEAELDAAVWQLCKLYGWRRYHTYRSKRSPAGFPDLVLVRPPRIIFAELKSEEGKLTPEQWDWCDALGEVAALTDYRVPQGPRVSCYTWRPHDLEEIARALAKRG